MPLLVEIASWICLVSGSFFCFVGGLGILRLPDFFSRLHGGSLTDTLGAALVLLGLMLQGGWSLVTAKLLTILLFLFLTSPTATHAIARAALESGLKPLLDDGKEA